MEGTGITPVMDMNRGYGYGDGCGFGGLKNNFALTAHEPPYGTGYAR